MKSLSVYITPERKFITEEHDVMARVHIDNCYSLGYKKEDIIYVTNWPFEYNGVKSIVVGIDNYYAQRPRSIKTSIIPTLIDLGIIEKGKIYWNHDFDAYQNEPITEEELGLGLYDMGFTDFGWKLRWCMGSFFFKDSSKDIFKKVKDIILTNIEDEEAMLRVSRDYSIAKRCKRLNITYDFGWRNVEENYERADKPLRILHFHPTYQGLNLMRWFAYRHNALKVQFMSDRLLKIFNEYGIR